MANPAKRKGTRCEHKVVNWFNKIFGCLVAKRVPLSGAAAGFKGDVRVDMARFGYPHELVCEVKSRKGGSGFKVIERWLGNNDLLLIWRDYEATPIVVMHGTTFQEFVELIIKGKEIVADEK